MHCRNPWWQDAASRIEKRFVSRAENENARMLVRASCFPVEPWGSNRRPLECD